MSAERRDSVKRPTGAAQPGTVREEATPVAKPFVISKHRVFEAFRLVKANAGSAGVDKQSIAAFEENLKDNLYELWNRMSSGSYMPPPVRAVPIPKKSGGERLLGVPTVSDRIAQMVVSLNLNQPLNRTSCRTPTGTELESQPSTPLGRRASGVGIMTGS
jgi:RNA-directed DNA polymerase